MKLTRTSIISASSLLIGGLIGASALVAMAQNTGTWTPPTATPPGGNVAAPINVGDSIQTKIGLLGLNALQFQPGGNAVATGSILVAKDQFGTVGWTSSNTTGGKVANLYGTTWGDHMHYTNSTWTDTGLSLNVTPVANTSKYLINANIDADNGGDPGACTVGLFQDSTLLVQFGVIGDPNDAVMPLSVSYVANAGNTNSRTYMVKVLNDCYLNYPQSNASGNNSATSTMTILEVN